MSAVDELVQGSYDLHAHMSPDPRSERRHDALQLALKAKEQGMGGLVMKTHDYSTAPLVWALSQFVKDIDLFGSIALNSAVGGINPEAAEVAARLGSKILWMPTHTAKGDSRGAEHKGVGVFDEDDRLIPEVYDVLDIVRQYDMALGTGHLGHKESFAVIDAAVEKGIKKIIYTHAILSQVGVPLSKEEQLDAAGRGVFIEHCAYSLMPTGERMAPQTMADAIKTVGAAHCILSSDLGQYFTPSAPEGFRLLIVAMLRSGISSSDVELMVKTNPRQLLGL
ncbi:MAG: DUF6282 family protein [Dehalococcoidia bacterium]|nr:DUF6282 family protein [Dehalococcoidia bacterium]